MTTYTVNCSYSANRNSLQVTHHLGHWIAQMICAYRHKAQISYERKLLAELSDDMLSDIGISRGDANAESKRRDIPMQRRV